MEVIVFYVLCAVCAIVIAGSGVAVYHYEKAIQLLKDELGASDALIKSSQNKIDGLRSTANHSVQQCAELRGRLLRQSRARAFTAGHGASHPGELLKELYFKNTALKAIAKQSGVSQSVIQRILVCKQAVTSDAAYKFEKAYGVSALMLLNMQANHDLQAISVKKVGEVE